MRIIFSPRTVGAAILAVAAAWAADNALAGRGAGSHGGFHSASHGGRSDWNRSFLPAQGELNTGGHWASGSSFGGVGMHWVPNYGGYGSGYSGYGGFYRGSQFGAGRDGFGPHNGGFFHRHGFNRRFGRGNDNGEGDGGGYWGGGGVWYGDLGDDNGFYDPSYDTGYYPAWGGLPLPPPAYGPAPVSAYAPPPPAPRLTPGPTMVNVSAPAAPNPHIIYLHDEPSQKPINQEPENRP